MNAVLYRERLAAIGAFPVVDASLFGRAFEVVLAGRPRVILPCAACGTPLWPGAAHSCWRYDELVLMAELAEIIEGAWNS